MPSHFVRRWLRISGALGLTCMLAVAPGCNLDRLRGEGFKGETKDWGSGLRRGGSDEDHAGLSTKAREIESHLGS